jgi:hypothetical protein
MATVRKPRLIDEIGDERIDHPEGFNPTDAAEAFQTAFSGASETARHAVETSRAMQEELTQFWQQRFQSNTEAMTQMMKCKSLPEVMETQQAWAKAASDQYTAYLTRMFGVMQSSFMRGIERK